MHGNQPFNGTSRDPEYLVIEAEAPIKSYVPNIELRHALMLVLAFPSKVRKWCVALCDEINKHRTSQKNLPLCGAGDADTGGVAIRGFRRAPRVYVAASPESARAAGEGIACPDHPAALAIGAQASAANAPRPYRRVAHGHLRDSGKTHPWNFEFELKLPSRSRSLHRGTKK